MYNYFHCPSADLFYFCRIPSKPRWPARNRHFQVTLFSEQPQISFTPSASATPRDSFQLFITAPSSPPGSAPGQGDPSPPRPHGAIPSRPPQTHSKALFPHGGFNEAHSTLPKTKGPSRFQTDLHDASVRHKQVVMATRTPTPPTGMPFSNSTAPQNPLLLSYQL